MLLLLSVVTSGYFVYIMLAGQFVYFSLLVSAVHAGGLDSVLRHYETLHASDVTVEHRMKRSIDSTSPCDHEKIVNFYQLGRHFRLRLRCQRGLFTRDFQAVLVDSHNEETSIYVDRTAFYEGFIEGESSTSKVNAYFEGENLVASIRDINETYYIEPSWRHLPQENHLGMVAYRASDLKVDIREHPEDHTGGAFCGFVHPDGDEAAYKEIHETTAKDRIRKDRRKRALNSNHDTCTLMLVGDYRFFDGIGQGETSTTVNYLIGSIARVDELYRGIDFDGDTNLGFEISQIRVHTEPTPVGDGEVHYNMAASSWDTNDLLKAFSTDSAFKDYCLAHLYTYTSFDSGVLGLSWIASPNVGDLGGICSPENQGNFYNTAWSSMLNKYGRRILTQEADIVTAHELGHSWGSNHDPDTTECAPSSRDGGSYIMYTYSVSGYDTNNKEFSPCSKRNIKAVLDNKGQSCFTAKSDSYCGNYKVEADEECDAGQAGLNREDPCCDANCQLIQGSACSDTNSDCCTGCQFSDVTTVCRYAANDNTTCEDDAYCTGSSDVCPDSPSRPDDSPCIDNGLCADGQCLSVCERNGLEPCACSQLEDSCKVCCADGDMVCTPYDNPVLDLGDGKPCVQGYCEAGVCVKQIQDLGDRLWNVIDNLSINYILRFFKRNLVISIVFLSLLVYVPLCIIVAVIDWKRNKKDKKEIEWHSASNDLLVMPGDTREIRQTYTRRRPTTRAASANGALSVSGVYMSSN